MHYQICVHFLFFSPITLLSALTIIIRHIYFWMSQCHIISNSRRLLIDCRSDWQYFHIFVLRNTLYISQVVILFLDPPSLGRLRQSYLRMALPHHFILLCVTLKYFILLCYIEVYRVTLKYLVVTFEIYLYSHKSFIKTDKQQNKPNQSPFPFPYQY